MDFDAHLASARKRIALAVRRDQALSAATRLQALFRGCSHRLAFRSRLYAYLANHDAAQLPVADVLLRRHAQARQRAGKPVAPIMIFVQLRKQALDAPLCSSRRAVSGEAAAAAAAAAATAATASLPSLAPTARVALELRGAECLRCLPSLTTGAGHGSAGGERGRIEGIFERQFFHTHVGLRLRAAALPTLGATPESLSLIHI